MNRNLQIFLIIFLLIGLYLVFKTVKKNRISMKYGMYWTIIFIFMLILIIFPNIIEYTSTICGFKEAPNMLFLIAIFVLFYIVFRLNLIISKINATNRKMIQEISLLKYEREKSHKK